MSISPREYIRHMLDEIAFIQSQLTGQDFDHFNADPVLKRAFVRSLEIIGEAGKKIPDEVKALHPQIEWRKITGIRDRLIHGYFGVDYQIVWDVAANKFPLLRGQLIQLLDSCPPGCPKG